MRSSASARAGDEIARLEPYLGAPRHRAEARIVFGEAGAHVERGGLGQRGVFVRLRRVGFRVDPGSRHRDAKLAQTVGLGDRRRVAPTPFRGAVGMVYFWHAQ